MNKGEDIRTSFLMPKEMYDKLDLLAKDSGVSRSYIIRTAIQEQIDSFEFVENE